MVPRRRGTVVVLVALLSTQPACSWMLIDEPPAHPTPSCTDERVLPATDIALGTVWLLPAMIATIFGVDHNECINGDCEMVEGNPDALVMGLSFFALAAAHYVSAGVGFKRTGRCRDRKRAFYMGGGYQQPPPMAPPGPPGSY